MRGYVPGCAAAVKHDDVYTWALDLTDFDHASPLARDLSFLPSGRGVVRIMLHFKRGLYPFFPPLVHVVGPRLKAPIHLALTTHAAVAWPTWKATRTIANVMACFRQVLEKHAQVELDAPGTKAFALHGTSAYVPLEQHIARLSALSFAQHSKAVWQSIREHQDLARLSGGHVVGLFHTG